jgi:hypothetical protein
LNIVWASDGEWFELTLSADNADGVFVVISFTGWGLLLRQRGGVTNDDSTNDGELQLGLYAFTSWSDGSTISFCRFLHLVTSELGGIFLEVSDSSWSLDLG